MARRYPMLVVLFAAAVLLVQDGSTMPTQLQTRSLDKILANMMGFGYDEKLNNLRVAHPPHGEEREVHPPHEEEREAHARYEEEREAHPPHEEEREAHARYEEEREAHLPHEEEREAHARYEEEREAHLPYEDEREVHPPHKEEKEAYTPNKDEIELKDTFEVFSVPEPKGNKRRSKKIEDLNEYDSDFEKSLKKSYQISEKGYFDLPYVLDNRELDGDVACDDCCTFNRCSSVHEKYCEC